MQQQERFVLETDGKGLWSFGVAKQVNIEGLQLYADDEDDFGELCVYFDTTSWDTDKDGLIYTDKLFMQGLKSYLTGKGIDTSDLGYSEQGMQGDDYVSCDVGERFINTFKQCA